MKKAESIEHYISNIQIFLDELKEISHDNFFIDSIQSASDAVITSKSISKMKLLLKELELMFYECDINEYRRIMLRINKDGYSYKNFGENLEINIQKILANGAIKSKTQYRDALFFVDTFYSENNMSDVIEKLNNSLNEYERLAP